MFADMPLVVTWLGQASFHFEAGGAGGIRILVEPFFAEYEARLYPPLSVDEFGAGVDWLLVTHEHIDHLDPFSLREVAARSPGLTVVAPASLEAMVREAADVGFVGVDRGDRLELDGAGAVTVVPAIHGRTVADGYPDDPVFVGYVLELEGTTLYHAGDTIVTDALRDALAPHGVDVALLPVNGRTYYREREGLVGNMGARDAVALATEIGASILVPYHWDLFRGNTEWPGRVVDAAVEAGAPLHVVTLRRGVPWAP
jgi:L-ascorbate metabolism protein UlaG (beta-lactamase superfamily)